MNLIGLRIAGVAVLLGAFLAYLLQAIILFGGGHGGATVGVVAWYWAVGGGSGLAGFLVAWLQPVLLIAAIWRGFVADYRWCSGLSMLSNAVTCGFVWYVLSRYADNHHAELATDVPFMVVSGLTQGLGLLTLVVRRPARTEARNACRACGYSLAGIGGTKCPECGTGQSTRD